MNTSSIESLADRIRHAARLTVLTGAGVSAASGVPTFRGAEGLWRQFRPEDLATADAFRRDPRLVWEWYEWRRARVAACDPNPAHDVLARWSRPDAGGDGRRARCTVVTQNVDDLHLRAGTHGLVRLHGSLWQLRCARACGAPVWREERVPLPRVPPLCPACGGLARPAIVWFGEALAEEDVAAATRACACDVFLAVGTSALVYPAAGFIHEAARRGAMTAEINAEATAQSSAVDIAIEGRAEEVLPALARALDR